MMPRGRSKSTPGLLLVFLLVWLHAATGMRMVGDQWPKLPGDQLRKGDPETIQEAFEEYEVPYLNAAGFKGLGAFEMGIHCGGHDDLKRINFRRVQARVQQLGIEKVFDAWDGSDDTIKDQRLNWRELRIGLAKLDVYDPFGKKVDLSRLEIEMIIRELTDDDTSEFVALEWGSSFYKTDGSDIETLGKHYASSPRMLMDGGTDNAMCKSEDGTDLDVCGYVRIDNFTTTMTQRADIKYSENCNGHGICDFSYGMCHCHPGWSGFNCSEPEKPCGGIVQLKKSYGQISDGYGMGRVYGSNLNCTWVIEPEHQDGYGLPILLTFTFLDMEAGFDEVSLYDVPYIDINHKLKAMGVGGTFPKNRWSMPHSVVVGHGGKVAVNFATDAANPSGKYYGFKMLFGRLDANYVKALSYPLLAPGCNRNKAAGTAGCLDQECTNCGVTLDEDKDNAVFQGAPENMCFSSRQAANLDSFGISEDYFLCQDTLINKWLTITAGKKITMKTQCPRGFMKPPTGFQYSMPEYIVGTGPPEGKFPVYEEGQAYQRGYVPLPFWSNCTVECGNSRKQKKYDAVFEDLPGKVGPIFVAQLIADQSSRASNLLGPYLTRPKSRVTGLQYGLDPEMNDTRTVNERNSMALVQLYQASFLRYTSSMLGFDVEVGKEYCEFSFTPTLPGIYHGNFFEMRKDRFNDKFAKAVPFPEKNAFRTAVVMPGRTSPAHSKAYGPGLTYLHATRTGIGVHFHIDTYDEYNNLRLTGGDKFIAALVHEQQEGQTYGAISNLYNGTYYVVYNVTLSGRYALSVTLPSSPKLCANPRRVLLTNEAVQAAFAAAQAGQTPAKAGRSSSTKQVRQLAGERCDVGTEFTVFKNFTGQWCTPIEISNPAAAQLGEQNCVESQYAAPGIPLMYGSPFSIWVDSGTITIDTVKAFGHGLSVAIAHYPSFFLMRIKDVFGNWASSLENITTGFEMPHVDQSMFRGSTTPTTSFSTFAGDEIFQGDYFAEWQPYIAGEHKISVMLCNPFCLHIIGSPFSAIVHNAPSYGPNASVHGIGIDDGIAGHLRTFEIQDRDSALNRRIEGGEDFELTLNGLSLADCPMIQDQVLLDISRKCTAIYDSTLNPCVKSQQDMQGPEVSLNIQPSLTCLYTRNQADCQKDCCPNGEPNNCSEFNQQTIRSGFSARSAGCTTRLCAFPSDCKFAVQRKQQTGQGGQQDLLQTFVNYAHFRCPQMERLGLEARLLLPPDIRKDGQFNLIIPNLEPFRPIWRGPMQVSEVMAWIKNADLAFLYYDQTKNALGRPYFETYGNATGSKDRIEGFVKEIASTQGRRLSKTSVGPRSASLNPSISNMVGDFSLADNDDGTYSIAYNITRAGLYSINIEHSNLVLHLAPFNFIVRPEVFHAKNSIVNGTGASKDKNLHTGKADYKGNQIAGKMVYFDISLRDRYWNYLWVSKPESDFKVYLDPMRIRWYDTTNRVERLTYWSVSFMKYTFHDYGDANYIIDYLVTTAGTFPLNIRLKAPDGSFVHLDKSPYMLVVRPDKVDIESSTAFGEGLTLCGAGLICTFAVETRDKWGNRRVLDGDEGPYCHTWNANVGNGGSGGNNWRTIFPAGGCTAGESCASVWMRWANTMPASGFVVDGPEEPQLFPAYNNEVAYHARGGILHDCIPMPPFSTDEEYNQRPSCTVTRQGPCGKYDEWGRLGKNIWKGDDGKMYDWIPYRAAYPDKRPRYTAFINGAQPAKYERFDIFVDADNFYSGSYNLTKGGNFKLSIVNVDAQTGRMQHVRGSPFNLLVTGGLTDTLKSIASGPGLQSAVVGYPGTFTVYARDRFANQRTLGREIVQVFIQPTNFGLGRIPALVHDALDGTYYVEYNATISGSYTMTVTLLEQDIAGSPFRLHVQKGFNFPHFNSSWGLHFAGSAFLQPEQGHIFCWGGRKGCVSQIRLNTQDKDSVGAVWYNTMQRVSYGFDMRFSFRISDLSRHCKTEVILEERCMARGGDGFAFVIHDNKFSHALGIGASSMGYGGIENSIAFEFDTWYNSELGDVYQNHFAVHTMGTEKNNPSSRSRLVTSTYIPNLSDGNVHTVRMRYEPWMEADSLLDPSYGFSPYSLQWIGSGAGTFKMWIDDLDRAVLTFPLNLENVLTLTEGRAFLGFTASTGAAIQNHFIHSWSYVDTVCRNDCNYRGDCIEGKCFCEDKFTGEDCSISAVEKQQKDLFLCPTQSQKPDSAMAARNCSCPAGSFGPIGGPCEACPVDTWKTAPGDSPCLACPPNSDTEGKAAVQDRGECRCKAGYIGSDGGPCVAVPEDTYKISYGTYRNSTISCPPNSGTVFRKARTNVLDCLCKPGFQGPNGGPCLICPTESWKSSWGDATCESQCPPFSETFGCQGPTGNTGCISSHQCVCKAGYYGQRCLLESPQYNAGKTCPPCVRTKYGPTNTKQDYDPYRDIVLGDGTTIRGVNPLYDAKKETFYTIPLADHRSGVDGVPEPKAPPPEYGTGGKPWDAT